MNRLLILLLSLSVLPAVLGDSLYKWVDAQGNVHYSDKPQPGATKVHLPNPTTYDPPTVEAPAPQAIDAQPQHAMGYSSFEIGSPTPDQVLWNVQSITVSIAITPGLHQGDTITITLDDKIEGPSANLSATFDDLDRGEHTVSASLSESGGGTMITKPVTFYIQKGTQKSIKKAH